MLTTTGVPARTGTAGLVVSRAELVTGLSRLVCIVMTLVSLVSAPTTTAAAAADQRTGLLAWLGLLVVAATATVLVARGLPARALPAVTVGSLVVDVAFYGAVLAVLRDGPNVTVWYALFLLLAAPLRLGWPGALGTGVAVGALAVGFPSLAPEAPEPAPALVSWALITCISGGALVLAGYARRSQAAVRLAEEQLRLAFQHATSGMAVLDEHLHVLQANPAMAALLGPDDLTGACLPARLGDASDAATVTGLLRPLAAAEDRTDAPALRREVRVAGPDGGDRWLLLSATRLPLGRRGARLVVQVEDVTERHVVQERLSRLARVDPLTGLLNRAALRELLDAALQTQPVVVLFVDLDRFKLVNDGLGHAAGDALLVEVAGRLTSLVRPGDAVARFGGDEFVLLCHGREGDATAVASRVVAALGQPVVVQGTECFVGASVGIAVGRPGATADAVLRDADTAMYIAKSHGGRGFEVFLPSMAAALARRHTLEGELRRAVDADGLHVHYQPIVGLGDGRPVGLEALVRWDHPVRGRMEPTEFVAVAEESDLVVALDAWVLRRALVESRDLRQAYGVPVSVNTSARGLRDPQFPGRLAEVLHETGTSGEELCLEVTETALADDLGGIVRVLNEVRRLGVRVAIDDFGTGHASLTYLAKLPVDVVKVDRTFTADIGTHRTGGAIVDGVVAMVHALGLRVVAEGVETEGQLEHLRGLGCDAGQGYRLLPAQPAAELAGRLAAASRGLAVVPQPRPGAVTGRAAGAVRAVPAASAAPGRFEEQYRLLLDLARDVGATEDLSEVLRRSLAALRRLVDFTGGSIQLLHADGLIRIAAGDPQPTPDALGSSLPLGVGVGGTVVASSEPAYLPDIVRDDRVPAARRRRSTSSGVRSYFAAPLIAGGRTIGLLQIDSTDVDAFDESARALVLAFAPVVAAAVREAVPAGGAALPWACGAAGAGPAAAGRA